MDCGCYAQAIDYRGVTSIFYCGVAKSGFRFYPKLTSNLAKFLNFNHTQVSKL